MRIAVVGLACRFPGGMNCPEEYWKNLVRGATTATDIPETRWNVQRFWSDDDQAAGRTYARRAAFMDWDIERFDAEFFGIAPREAEYLDPQQRLLLEVSWEALENAGVNPLSIAGQEVGVYIGGFTLDHMLNQLGSNSRGAIGAHSATGSTLTMLANRISYIFDFRGPSFSVDTACSSSLVAFAYGCHDIAAGRCPIALVGGVNVMLRPEYPIAMSKGRFLASDGCSKSFDARADGYGRGEGAGVVVLKPLDAALAAGDDILAVVDGVGVNQDGRTSGITVPSPDAQKALMRRVLDEAYIDPRTVGYVEAHGTGTPVGDPAEFSAINAVYGGERETPCYVGSVKNNIGHLEAAAGVAGVVKAVLMLKHNVIPSLATLETPNPDLPLTEGGVALADAMHDLAPEGKIRRIAINSFGYGGTNAHVVLSYPPRLDVNSRVKDTQAEMPGPNLLPVSARNDEALRNLAGQFSERLADESTPLGDILYTASHRRAHLSHRLAVWGERREDFVSALHRFAETGEIENGAANVAGFGSLRKPVFVYTGMGPQWWGMGQQLYREIRAYREAAEEASKAFQQIGGFSILDEMLKDEATSRIGRTDIAQPANFVLQYALTAALRDLGIEPGAVVGHSVGEVSAACISGKLSLADAARVAFHRSRIQKKAAGQGGMLAVGLSAEEALELIAGDVDRVSLAAVNGPTSITLAGDTARLEEIARGLQARQVFARVLTVEVPYHSPMMEPLKPEILECLSDLTSRTPRIPLYSTVIGGKVEPTLRYDAAYWCRNVREPVFFANTVEALLQDGHTLFAEIGPHPVLRTGLRQTFAGARVEAHAIETLRHESLEVPALRRATAELYTLGGDLDWSAHHTSGRLASLPNYPWQRVRHWREPERMRRDRLESAPMPLLGRKEGVTNTWSVELADQRLAYMKDHVVNGMAVMPAAGYLEALSQIAASVLPEAQGLRLRNVQVERALVLDAEKLIRMELRYDPESASAQLWSLSDEEPDKVTRHASANLHPLPGVETLTLDPETIRGEMSEAMDSAAAYARFREFDLEYGPMFQPIEELLTNRATGRVLAKLNLPEPLHADAASWHAHPVLLDGCFQSALALLDPNAGAFLPTSLCELQVRRPLPRAIWCLTEIVARTGRAIECNLTIASANGEVVAMVQGMTFTALNAGRLGRTAPEGDYAYAWSRHDLEAVAPQRLRWLLLAEDGDDVADALARLLPLKGAEVTVATIDDQAAVERARRAKHFDGVVFLAPLSEETGAVSTGEGAVVALQRLLKELAGGRSDRTAPRLYAITRGAFAVTGQDGVTRPAHGAVNGFIRAAHNELGELRCSTLDLASLSDEVHFERLAEELVADALEDEVALRSDGRYVSALKETGALAEPLRVPFDPASGDRAVFEPVAIGRLAARLTRPEPLSVDDVEVRLECVVLGNAVLRAAIAGTVSERSMMGFVGHVTRSGTGVESVNKGDRLFGIAPAELGTHLRLNPESASFAGAPDDVAAEPLAEASIHGALSLRLAKLAALGQGDTALVCGNAVGTYVGEALRAQGVETVHFPGDPQDWTYAALKTARAKFGGGFDVIVAPLVEWRRVFGFDGLVPGGCLLETGDGAVPLHCDKEVGRLVRIDLFGEIKRDPQGMRQALEAVARSNHAMATDGPRCISLGDLLATGIGDVGAEDSIAIVPTGSASALEAVADGPPALQADGIYLVTGGFGGLGREVACWLAKAGAGHIALIGRRGAAGAEEKTFMRQVETLGPQVSAHACDVSDFGAVETLIEDLERGGSQLRGVVHTAGVVEDKPIVAMDETDIVKVMRPKALGAWVLHQVTKTRPLDMFILFSSISVLVGNSRQANYCAANGFLDALAHQRRLSGLPGLSVNWGAISSVGMLSHDDKTERHLRQIGLAPLSFDAGLVGVERALQRDLSQICIAAKADWDQWARYETSGGRSPRFAALVAAARETRESSKLKLLSVRLAELAVEDRVSVLARLMAEIFAQELKMPVEQLDISRSLSSTGVDSLMATEIQLALETTLGLPVSTLELIGDGTVMEIAQTALEGTGLGETEMRVAAE